VSDNDVDQGHACVRAADARSLEITRAGVAHHGLVTEQPPARNSCRRNRSAADGRSAALS
jgi:hypothetical protein